MKIFKRFIFFVYLIAIVQIPGTAGSLSAAERLEITVGSELKSSEPDKSYNMEVESVRLERSK